MSEKPKTYHHGNLSAALIAAGMKVLRQDGAEKLSLRAVAEHVGVSRTAPYAHFPDKRALLLSISAAGFEALTAQMRGALDADGPPREQVLALGAAYVRFALDNQNLYRLMLSTMTSASDGDAGETFGAAVKQAALQPHDLIREQFLRMAKDPDRTGVLSQGAWGMVHGLASLMGEGLVDVPDGGVEKILRTFMEALPKA